MSGKGNSGAWKGNKNWNQQAGSAKKEEKQELKVKEPFVLPGSPGTTVFYAWLDAIFSWASERVFKWGWHRVLDRQNPGQRPEAVEPDMPDPDDFEFDHAYTMAEKVYVNRMTRFDKAVEEIKQDKVLLFNKMKNNLSTKVQREIEDRHEMAAYAQEDPVNLLDALKETCLGKPTGQLGNPLDIAKQRKNFAAIIQRHSQTVQDFYEFYCQAFEALIQSETSGGKTREEIMESDWPEAERVQNFIGCLSERQVGDWLDEIRFESKEMPATLEEAFKDACLAAKQYSQKMKRMNNAEHIGTFATVTRDGNNSGGRNGGRGRGGRSGRGGGQGRENQSRQPVYDEDGKACCFDYMDNQCKRGKAKAAGGDQWKRSSSRPRFTKCYCQTTW